MKKTVEKTTMHDKGEELPETETTPRIGSFDETRTARECALIAAKAADQKKATDIMVQDVSDIISITEYFVIATATNNRQVEAIIESVEEAERKEAHIKPIHTEGLDSGTWALLDYGEFVVHVFQPEARDYYRLETLWNDAPIIDLKEAGVTDAVYSDRIAKLLGKKPTDTNAPVTE